MLLCCLSGPPPLVTTDCPIKGSVCDQNGHKLYLYKSIYQLHKTENYFHKNEIKFQKIENRFHKNEIKFRKIENQFHQKMKLNFRKLKINFTKMKLNFRKKQSET